MRGRRRENDDVTALGRWAVGPSVNISFPEHISKSTCPIVFKFYSAIIHLNRPDIAEYHKNRSK